MALVFDNCLIQRGFGVNQMITDCCCYIQCTVTTDAPVLIDDIIGSFDIDAFYFASPPKPYINGIQQTVPFFMTPNDSLLLEMEICPSGVESLDILKIDFSISGVINESFKFDIQSNAPSSFFSPISLNFGNVAVGGGSVLYINIPDTLICCNNFFVSEMNPPFSNAGSINVCPGTGSQQIAVFFSPTQLGSATEDLNISINECNFILIPVTGNGIEPPSGSAIPQKNKVDQTTRVEACSPRTANNRCQTARTMQTAIRTNARRFGKR